MKIWRNAIQAGAHIGDLEKPLKSSVYAKVYMLDI